MRVASPVYVADLVEGRALFPLREGNGAQCAVGVGELEDVVVVLGGRRPVPGVGGAAGGSEDVGGVARVGCKGVAQYGMRALGESAGGDGVGVWASPQAMMEGVGEAVSGAA